MCECVYVLGDLERVRRRCMFMRRLVWSAERLPTLVFSSFWIEGYGKWRVCGCGNCVSLVSESWFVVGSKRWRLLSANAMIWIFGLDICLVEASGHGWKEKWRRWNWFKIMRLMYSLECDMNLIGNDQEGYNLRWWWVRWFEIMEWALNFGVNYRIAIFVID